MKALRKKYGKRRWEDTPNAAWYRKRKAQAWFLNSSAMAMMAAVGNSQMMQIRSSEISSQEKAKALADSVTATYKAIADASKTYPYPDPNNS